MPSAPRPGWYADPATAGMLRWWDGQQWTQAQQPLRPLPAVRPRPAVPPHAGHNERLGRIAIVSRAALLIFTAALYASLLGDLIRGYVRLLTTMPGQAPLVDFGSFQRSALLFAASSLLVWVPIPLLAVWTYRSATAGAALGIPAEIEPMWGAVGWLVPVLQYWFPYQAVRDCLPREHPRRRAAAWWWCGDLSTAIAMPVVGFIAVLGLVPFLVVWIVFTAATVATAVLGLRVARAIDDAHRAARAQAGLESQAQPAQTVR